MTENVSNLSLLKVKQDILIVFHAREILIPENRSNASVNQAGLLTLISLAKLHSIVETLA